MTNSSPHATPAQCAVAAADVINSAAPIENELLGLHPRLLTVRRPLSTLQQNLSQEPWSTQYAPLLRQADKMIQTELPADIYNTPYSVFDVRSIGSHLITLALAYKLSGRECYLNHTTLLMERLAAEPHWGHSLIYGHWAQGFSFALDWLWHDLTPDTRQSHIETLYQRTHHVFQLWASYRAGEPFGYTWNISSVVLGGVTATAAVLYGERPDIAPLANLCWEKMRLQSFALGPDGLSPEGIMYGGYYSSYLTINFHLAEELFGLDMFKTSPWLQRYASSLLAQTLPRNSWRPDNLAFMQGDTHGSIFGVEGVLRAIASGCGDGLAQWLADELIRAGHAGMGAFSLLLYDPTITPTPPAANRAPFDLLEDFGLALSRSNWSGTECASAFKCGPNVGHHAAQLFRHPLGGGHMYPNNGDLQIFAQGEWILPPPGYVYKDTSYHNTLLVNDKGQLGDSSEWFEDLPYRRSLQYPYLERAEHHGSFDYTVANLTAAYQHQAKLHLLRRHLIYLRNNTWVVIDALSAAADTSITALFHTTAPLSTASDNTFHGAAGETSFTITAHHPSNINAATSQQTLLHSGGTPQGELSLLRLTTAPARALVCAVSIQVAPPDTPTKLVSIKITNDNSLATIVNPDTGWSATIDLFGTDGLTVISA